MAQPERIDTPENFCPECGKKFNAVSDAIGSDTPRAGDLTICINCGSVLALNEDFTCRRVTSAEWFDVIQKPELLATIKRVQGSVLLYNQLTRRAN